MNFTQQLLVKVTEGLYKETQLDDISVGQIDIKDFIRSASENNVLFYGAKALLRRGGPEQNDQERLKGIVEDGEKKVLSIKRTLQEVDKLAPDVLLFKTFRGRKFERIPNDIDVASRRFEYDLNRFRNAGFEMRDFDERDGSVQLLKRGMWKVHLHRKISWAWEEFFDLDMVFENPRKELFNGYEIQVPNVSADVLIHLAHMNFEPLNIVLGELLYLFDVIPKMDMKVALHQTRKYRWERTFCRTLGLINSFHQWLYGSPLIDGCGLVESNGKDVTFPYSFHRWHLIQAVLEKQMVVYPLTRIVKVLSILFSGDTFTKYITPSDRESGRGGA